jgi:lysozyme
MRREGIRHEAYLDTRGIWTIGVGHTGPEVHRGLIWTDEQIADEFMRDSQWAVRAVNCVVASLNQNMFDALVSFTFNVGAGAFGTSTMKKFLDKGLYKDAADQFPLWDKPPEILGRRLEEQKQFLSLTN